MNAKYSTISFGVALMLLTFLPSCWWTNKENKTPTESPTVSQPMDDQTPTGDAIVTMNGKPFITKQMIKAQKEKILGVNPQIKMMNEKHPEQVDQILAHSMLNEKMIEKYVKDEGIDQTKEYRDDLAILEDWAKQQINVKFFAQKFPTTVSDADLKEFYEQNKPMLMLSPGSITVSALQFDNEPAAKAFMATVKQHKNDFKKAAQESGLSDKIKEFKSVTTRTTGMDPMLRDKILAIKQTPSLELFAVNSVAWVVNATEKEEAKYRPFEQVKEGFRSQLEQKKQAEVLSLEVEKLKTKYNIELDKSYFEQTDMGPEMDEEELEEMMKKGE